MTYRITKFCFDRIELSIFEKEIVLTNDNPHYIANEDEYEEILSKYNSLITHQIILVERIKDEIKEDKTKFNKHK